MNDIKDWKFLKLSELATFRRGSFPQPYGLDKWYDDENGFPFVQVFDVGDNMKLKDSTKRKISSAAGELSVFVKKGTIVLTIQGSIGRIAITHYDTYVDRTLLIFKTFTHPTDKRYFMYVVHRLFEDEKQRAHGSTIKTITKEQLSSFVIPFPPLPEQKKIADILSTVDAKIEVIDQQIKETEELKKGLMQRLFTKGIGHTEFKDSPLGEIPKSWEVVKLEDLGEFFKGKGISKSEILSEGQYPCIRYGEIYTMYDTIVYKFQSFINQESANKSNPIESGDLLFTGSGETMEDIGKCVTYIGNELAFASGDLIIHRPEKGDSRFLAYYMNSQIINNQTRKMGQGNSVVHIYTKHLSQLMLSFPSIQEQKNIAKILGSVDDKLDVLEEKKAYYLELKQGLMQKLLTGKIRVNNLVEA